MNEFKVEFYKRPNGECPSEEFIKGLDPKMQSKAFRCINYLQEKGLHADRDVTKHLENGIFELRIQQSNNICRILYFFYIDQTIVFTNGFVKKTQRTPRREIDRAKRLRQEYYQRRDVQ